MLQALGIPDNSIKQFLNLDNANDIFIADADSRFFVNNELNNDLLGIVYDSKNVSVKGKLLLKSGTVKSNRALCLNIEFSDEKYEVKFNDFKVEDEVVSDGYTVITFSATSYWSKG